MPFVSTILKKEISEQYEALVMLENHCKECKLFVGKEAELTFIYAVSNPILPKIDTMVAISKYDKKYAMRVPDWLTDEELIVFDYVLRDVEPDEEIVVFLQRDYDAVKKYLRGRKNKVILCK